jgi:hypothetical protein
VPEVKNKASVKTPIDAFVLAKLEEKGLVPDPAAATRPTCVASDYDLIGLPPTSEQVDTFVKACDNAALADSLAARSGRPAGNLEAV